MPSTKTQQEAIAYLKNDRQWLRKYRTQYYSLQAKITKGEEREFWQLCLEAVK